MAGVVIIGAGQAGAQAAISLRQMKYEGEITILGEESHLPYERPPLSKAFLLGEQPIEKSFLRSEDFYKDQSIDLRRNVLVKSFDPKAKTVRFDGGEIDYDDLIIATGTRAREINIPGANLEGVAYLRTVDDALALQAMAEKAKSVAVIGGGYIGMETAASLRKMGCEVTVFEFLDRVMARGVAPQVSDFFTKVHKDKGVDIQVSTGVTAFKGEDRVEAVVTSKGESVPVDLVIVGIGAVANDELAREAGIACENGIIVDEFSRSSDEHVYAVGDVAFTDNLSLGFGTRLESVHNAIAQSKAAASAVVGQSKAYNEVPWFWTQQYDYRLQMAGVPMDDDDFVLRGSMEEGKFAVFALRDGILKAVNACNSAQEYVVGMRLIGMNKAIDPAVLSDPATNMKELLKA